VLLRYLDKLPGPFKTYAYKAVKSGPFFSWKFLIFTTLGMAFFWVLVYAARNEPGMWQDAATYMLLIIPIIGFPTFALCIYGKFYDGRLDLPPLEGKHRPLPNLGYLIFAGIGAFNLLAWMLSW
jgi:hypothetical protein